MTQRFFRAAENVYESVRRGLDQAWGHRPDETAYMPAAYAHKDAEGRVYLAVNSEWCDFAAVSVILPDLLASHAVEEISEAEYHAATMETEMP